jgi:porphobilinogen deaminase
MTLKLGTRGSALALAQSQLVANEVQRLTGETLELV